MVVLVDEFPAEVLQRSTMFIAQDRCAFRAPSERNVLARQILHPASNGAAK